METIVDRFIRYCSIASQSNPLGSGVVPSTPGQWTMARAVAADLEALGAEDVEISDYGYVTAHWPGSLGTEDLPRLGLIAHLDTAWQAKADPVHPRVVTYGGGDLVMGKVDGRTIKTSPEEVPELERYVGQDIVVTDGTTLLGADDKAGVVEILGLLERLKEDPSLPHPPLAVAFVPDEEIGHGAAYLDLGRWGAQWAYTVDGGPLGELSFENFNAAEAHLKARGKAVHTGTARGLLVSASEALMRFHGMLPPQERPEFTHQREGFFYLERMEGSCEEASADYLIRDHDAERFELRKEQMRRAVDLVNREKGEGTLSIEIHDQYRNMKEGIEPHGHLVMNAQEAFRDCGVQPLVTPVRGGTDGAQLTFRGLPCPNISGGFYNAHGPKEFCPVSDLEKMVDVLVALVGRYGQPQGPQAV